MRSSSTSAYSAFGATSAKRESPDTLYDTYVRDATRYKLLTKAEERRLGLAIRAGGRGAARARRILSQSNLRLVLAIARRFEGRGLPLMDLVQEGNIGLMRAVTRFDARRGYRFSTYATWWISQAMQRALLGTSRVVRMPICALDITSKAKKAAELFRQERHREPAISDLAAALKRRPDRLLAAMRGAAGITPVSLDNSRAPGDSGTGTSAASRLEAVEAAPPVLEKSELKRILGALDRRQQKILIRRYGLDGRPEETLQQIARRIGVSRERIRQLQSKAIRHLRSNITELLPGGT